MEHNAFNRKLQTALMEEPTDRQTDESVIQGPDLNRLSGKDRIKLREAKELESANLREEGGRESPAV